ncbi:MAG: ABC transporter permease [Propionibacteriaceae bacterium]|jgi:simple sugar transport system permease protein|nr:ABC transporter permease [Propionibacteriaceae bacterium]
MSALTVPTTGPLALAKPLQPINWKQPIALTALTVLVLGLLTALTTTGAKSVIAFDTGLTSLGRPTLTVPTRATVVVLGLLALLVTAYSWWATATRRKKGAWVPIVAGTLLVAAFLVWAVGGKGQPLQFTALLSGALFLSVPLVFGALSGCVCEHVGVINVSIEGQLLAGAFLAGVIGSATGNAWLGLICAPLAGALIGALLALFAVRYWVDHIIVGVVLNVLVTGLTSYLFSTVMQTNSGTFMRSVSLPKVSLPLLSQIPVLGPILFRQNVLTYIMFIAVVALQVYLFRSRWGLRMRACGEHPKAADTVGIKVNRTRIRNTILGGAIAGLGGAYFTVAAGLAFGKEMSAGRGYIALAAMILGGWKPKGAIAAALLFGFADNLQGALGVVGVAIPSQFMLMAPYLVTIFAVAGIVGKVRPPAQEGTAYKE